MKYKYKPDPQLLSSRLQNFKRLLKPSRAMRKSQRRKPRPEEPPSLGWRVLNAVFLRARQLFLPATEVD